mgnify:CR=1 FL=1
MGIQTASQAISNEGVSLGYKNKIINGNMAIAQRGTTATLSGSPTYASIDRWAIWQGGGGASGYFNPLHKGHVEYLEKARELGDYLIVIVNSVWFIG